VQHPGVPGTPKDRAEPAPSPPEWRTVVPAVCAWGLWLFGIRRHLWGGRGEEGGGGGRPHHAGGSRRCSPSALTWFPGSGGGQPFPPLSPVNPGAEHHGEDVEDVQPQVAWDGGATGRLQHPQAVPTTPPSPSTPQRSPRASPSVILPK